MSPPPGSFRRDLESRRQVNGAALRRDPEVDLEHYSAGRRLDQLGLAVLAGRFTRLVDQIAVQVPISTDIVSPLGDHQLILTGFVQHRIMGNLPLAVLFGIGRNNYFAFYGRRGGDLSHQYRGSQAFAYLLFQLHQGAPGQAKRYHCQDKSHPFNTAPYIEIQHIGSKRKFPVSFLVIGLVLT